jgi:F-type H+-transporting ATPase subunit b
MTLSPTVVHSASVLLAAEEGEPNPLLPHMSELIVGSIAFLLLFLFLRAKVFPVFERTFAERRNAIEGGMERAKRAEAEAKEALEQYRAQLAEARHEAARLREDAREQGAAILAEMREQAQAESRRITDAAHQQIEADRQQAVNQLRVQVGALATDLASRIVGESLEDDARQRRVIDRFLDELEDSAGDGKLPEGAQRQGAHAADGGAGEQSSEGTRTGAIGVMRAAAAAVADAVTAVKEPKQRESEGRATSPGIDEPTERPE